MKDEEGFNAQTEQYENLVQAGVIDPTKVVRSALQNAASIASLLLTTEAVISQIPEEHDRAAMPGAAWGGCTKSRTSLIHWCIIEAPECSFASVRGGPL